MSALTDAEISEELLKIPDWKHEGSQIVREVKLPAYLDAVDVFAAIASISESMNHHPEVGIGWKMIRISLTTHSAPGLTDKDFDLAQRIDEIVADYI